MDGVLHSFSFAVMFLFMVEEEVPPVHVSAYKSNMQCKQGQEFIAGTMEVLTV